MKEPGDGRRRARASSAVDAGANGARSASRPELRQLRYFVAVAESAQLTDAARQLSIAQPTLSQALAQLEERLGVQLLERHARGVRLTAAGQVFLEKARAAVIAADAATDSAHAFRRAESGAIAVGFNWLPLTRWASMFQRLCERSPGTQLSWQPLEFPVAGRSPIEGLDVGLLLEPTPRTDMSTLRLLREPRVAMMAAGHRLAGRTELTVADLLDETWPGCNPAMDPRWQGFWTLDEERGGPARSTDERILTIDEGTAVVASGRAIVTVAAGMAAAMPHPGLVAVPIVDARPATLVLAWHAQHENPLVDVLIDIAKQDVAV